MIKEETLRIFLADDHQIFIEGLKAVLKDKAEYEVVGETGIGNELLKKLKKTEVDLLLLDMNLPDMDGLEILGKIRSFDKNFRVIILTMYEESKIVKAAFKAGVDGYILKGSNIKELFNAIEVVMKGHTFMGKGVRLTNGFSSSQIELKSGMTYEERFIKKYHLTKREIEVLKLISQALSNKEIAKSLYISDQTVSVHRKNVMRKLGVSNTASLIKLAYDNNLI